MPSSLNKLLATNEWMSDGMNRRKAWAPFNPGDWGDLHSLPHLVSHHPLKARPLNGSHCAGCQRGTKMTKNLCPLKSSWHGADSPHFISRQWRPLKSRGSAWKPINVLQCPHTVPAGVPSLLSRAWPGPTSLSTCVLGASASFHVKGYDFNHQSPPPAHHHCHFINTQTGLGSTQPLNKRSALS